MDSREYIKFHLDHTIMENKVAVRKKEKSIALIGLGPHAKRIYLCYFKKHRMNLSLVVELESKKEETRKYLDENGFRKTKIFTIDDAEKDKELLPSEQYSNLLSVCKVFEITHIVISTEPKAHNMYIQFALENNIHVLTDKPITVVKNMLSISSIKKVRNQYYEILRLASHSSSMCKVMCQRQYHKGYQYIKNLLNEVVTTYQVPITYIDIYHCDGNWEMLHDLEKENHPYKYGYGKLFHSGYHFIDLLSDFIKINNQLPDCKRIVKGELHSSPFTPNDEIGVFTLDDYKRIFKNQEIPEYYDYPKNRFRRYGEKNFYGSLDFKNRDNQLMTHVNLNLLHYGFSRRGWIASRDYYKDNGRIRHEMMNIQVGTLMNIQVHSYQSKEIKDRKKLQEEELVGGLEHFDIDIYRNVDIIGGKPFERIKLGDLYTEKEKQDMLGYNELSREEYLTNFFQGKCDRGDIKDQALAIEILSSCAMSLSYHFHHRNSITKIRIGNKYSFPLQIANLKQYAETKNDIEEKEMIQNHPVYDDIYEYDVVMNYLNKKGRYEVYLYLAGEDHFIGGLLYKEFRIKMIAKLYFFLLQKEIDKKDIYRIVKICSKKR